MNDEKHAKPSEALVAWLEGQLGTLSPGARLPTDRRLAEAWNLSERTVRRILKEYCNRGKLQRVQGKGTFLPAPTPAIGDEPQAKPLAADTLSTEILAMISDGRLRQGDTLPQIKLLCMSFRVNPATVIQAYRRLVEAGIVTKVGKRYFVGDFQANAYHAARRRACFINSGGGTFRELLSHPAQRLVYQRMERELLRNGYALEYHGYEEADDLLAQWTAGRDAPQALVVGWLNHKRYEETMPRLRLFRERARPHRPGIVVYTESSKRPPSGIHQVCSGNISTLLSRRLAQYCFEHRYRNVALFYSCDTKTPRTLTAFSKVIPELRHLIPGLAYRWIIVSSEWAGNPDGFFERLAARYPVGRIDRLLSKYGPYPLAGMKDRGIIVDGLERGLRECRSADAWLFALDADAAAALSFAARSGIKVPEEVSIIGTENSDDYLHLGITCCVEDWDAIGYLLAHTVIGDIPIARTHKGFVKPSALVLERGTTP